MIAHARITKMTNLGNNSWKIAVTFYDAENRRRRYKPIIETPTDPQFHDEWLQGPVEDALYSLAHARNVQMPPFGLNWILSEAQEAREEALIKAYLYSYPSKYSATLVEGVLTLECPRCTLPTALVSGVWYCPAHAAVPMIQPLEMGALNKNELRFLHDLARKEETARF